MVFIGFTSSPNYSTGTHLIIPSGLDFGGDMRDRTADLLNANQTLSQLSYVPNIVVAGEVSDFRLSVQASHSPFVG